MSTTEKAHVMRQVGTGKANASEPLLKCRKRSDGNRNRGPVAAPGRAGGIPVYCPGGCPARRWREPGPGAGTKRGNPSPWWRGPACWRWPAEGRTPSSWNC